jgi:hypothetical protein
LLLLFVIEKERVSPTELQETLSRAMLKILKKLARLFGPGERGVSELFAVVMTLRKEHQWRSNLRDLRFQFSFLLLLPNLNRNFPSSELRR